MKIVSLIMSTLQTFGFQSTAQNNGKPLSSEEWKAVYRHDIKSLDNSTRGYFIQRFETEPNLVMLHPLKPRTL